MSAAITKTAFDNMLAFLQDAIAVADDALVAAETQSRGARELPPVVLTKVASATAQRVASALARTGVFPEWKTAELANKLQSGSPTDYIEFLEKLASRAMFPLNVVDDLRGDLVDKSAKTATNYDSLPRTQAIWQQARDEAIRELRS